MAKEKEYFLMTIKINQSKYKVYLNYNNLVILSTNDQKEVKETEVGGLTNMYEKVINVAAEIWDGVTIKVEDMIRTFAHELTHAILFEYYKVHQSISGDPIKHDWDEGQIAIYVGSNIITYINHIEKFKKALLKHVKHLDRKKGGK